jgi:4,5-DOPA dioxygenase extradiol
MTSSTHTTTSQRMPVVFLGHGSPMNAIDDNRWSQAWISLGLDLPIPSAILCVSAHWYVRGTFVTGNASPNTIYDFSGFPRKLYEVRYPARGDEALARRITTMLTLQAASVRDDWGLDHGTWSVLRRLRPMADVPVLQLSIDRGAPAAAHLAIGRALAPLRDQGVLVLGSGNITHNLSHALRWDGGEQPSWAVDFDRDIAQALEQHDEGFLIRALETDAGRKSHPTAEHFLPLLYAMGAATQDDQASFPVQGFELGSLSMRSVRFG